MDIKNKENRDTLIIRIAAIVGAVVIAGFCLIFFFILKEMNAHLGIYDAVQTQLGFTYETPYLIDSGDEALVITEVVPGKPMDVAGIKPGDRYDTDGALVIPFINSFVFHQGETITLPILRDGEHLNIAMTVPLLQLEVDPYTLHYPFTKYTK